MRLYTKDSALPYDPIFSINNNIINIDECVSVQTWRYFINEKIAALLDCTYLCTSLRYPVECYALKKKIQYRDLADELFCRITDVPKLTTNVMERPRPSRISLPNPFSIIVNRAKKKEAIWEEIAKLRDSFQVVRKAIRKAKKQGKCDEKIVSEMTDSLEIKGKIPALIDGLLVGVSTYVGSIPTQDVLCSTILKVASTLKPAENATRMLKELLHPEMRFIHDFKNHVDGLYSTIQDIDKLWSNPIDRNWVNTMIKIGEFNDIKATELGWRA